ncbi:hypothetical protein [Nocardioides panaciterrulae]|uniref:Uncharacterized protein n=1 Tax=Nocardioides panaciterrulae TaxID=661492 RepID=A0A7Y9E3T5_9ACTN|nr:hypothetical protein [Nocardioides panaciterrulae]NYD40512.1 hypothetical protein [Nocardioides panaciterrulae]
MTTRRILTLHAPVGKSVLDGVLTSLEQTLVDVGAERVWIDPTSADDLTVLADFPEPATNEHAVPAPRAVEEAEGRKCVGR